MKIINEIYENLTIPEELYQYSVPDETIFFDIETTGLNKVTTSLYLIGCGFYENGFLNTRFFFADSENEELNVLNAFFDFIKNYKSVIHFNGTKFDLPYLVFKAQKYNIENPLENMESIDIYRMLKPLRKILFKESMRQKCVEDFMGIEREDLYNGGQLIDVYRQYTQKPCEDAFKLLMLHNREDVLGMHKIFPILSFLNLTKANVNYISHVINEYTDYNGDAKKEIIIDYALDISIPKSFTVQNNTLYFKFCSDKNSLHIRIPITNGIMKHYYENYKDYVYLIKEKKCIHKSIATSIDKSLKVNANKESCYTKVSGQFIPTMGYLDSHNCGPDYKNRNQYIFLSIDSSNKFSDFPINEYGKNLLNELLKSKPRRQKESLVH